MANPLFKALGGGENPMLEEFRQFMTQMQGKNPNAMIQDMVQSGKISQQQLNEVQQKAMQMQNFFAPIMGMFQR